MALIAHDPFVILQGRVEAWERCGRIPGCDKAVWRQDAEGRVIRWSDFGDRFSRYGWELVPRQRSGVLRLAFPARPAPSESTRSFRSGRARLKGGTSVAAPS